MQIWAGKIERDRFLEHCAGTGVRDFRMLLRVLFFEHGDLVFFDLTQQVMFEADKPGATWHGGQCYAHFRLNFDRHVRAFFEHIYYDGCNKALNFGPLQFYWQPDSCKICSADFAKATEPK